jgi:hypothetical protein
MFLACQGWRPLRLVVEKCIRKSRFGPPKTPNFSPRPNHGGPRGVQSGARTQVARETVTPTPDPASQSFRKMANVHWAIHLISEPFSESDWTLTHDRGPSRSAPSSDVRADVRAPTLDGYNLKSRMFKWSNGQIKHQNPYLPPRLIVPGAQ